MYESPIEIIQRDIANGIQAKMENDICNVICSYGINVNRDELIKALNYDRQQYEKGYRDACNRPGYFNTHQVACMLADIFKDNCACNYNGNDEWLPKVCDLADTSCPDTFGVACWEQFVWNYFKKQGGDTE